MALPPQRTGTPAPGLEAREFAALTRLPLFAGLDASELSTLRGVLKTKWVAPDEVLFREGDRAAACYVLLSGNISIEKRLADGRVEVLATLVPGGLVGEMALIDGRPRSAGARPHNGPAVLLVLEREDFDRLFGANRPFAFKVLDRIVTDLAGRLRRATGRLVEASREEAPEDRAARAREAAASLLGMDLTQLDLGDIDLDAITYEIQEPRRGPRPGA